VTTVSRGLPERPHLDVPKREARELLDLWRNGDRGAFDRIRRRHPRFADADDAAVAAGPFRLNDAQLVIAREYGLAHWTELKQRVAVDAVAKELAAAIRADDWPRRSGSFGRIPKCCTFRSGAATGGRR
jgi:hypothetical protein